MRQTRRQHLASLAGVLAASRLRGADQVDFLSWTDAQKEKFLTTATVVSATDIGHGVTKPVKVQLEAGGIRHDAAIQVVDKELPDFFPENGPPVPMRDSWRFNIAAYRVDRLLQLNMVTVSAERSYKGKRAGFSWWVDGVMFEEVDRIKKELQAPDPEAFERQRALMRVFDELIINIDRNLANLLITKSWNLALIDHSRSFNPYPGIRNKANLTRCSKSLLARMRTLTQDSVSSAVKSYLTPQEIDGLLKRRDRIVEFFEQKAKQSGEQNVLFA
jgi:hypothetical protein